VDRTHDGRKLRQLTIIDEYRRECLAIEVQRRLRSDQVLFELAELFTIHSPPEHIRSDNGPEFTANVVREWLRNLKVKTLFIEPGSPWEMAISRASLARCGMHCSTVRCSAP